MQLRSRLTGETHRARGGEEGLAVPGHRAARISDWPPAWKLSELWLCECYGDSMMQPWLIKSLVSKDYKPPQREEVGWERDGAESPNLSSQGGCLLQIASILWGFLEVINTLLTNSGVFERGLWWIMKDTCQEMLRVLSSVAETRLKANYIPFIL